MCKNINPGEAIAYCAAVQAAILSEKGNQKINLMLHDTKEYYSKLNEKKKESVQLLTIKSLLRLKFSRVREQEWLQSKGF